MITQSLINAGVILGITIVTSRGHLLYFIRAYLESIIIGEMQKEYLGEKYKDYGFIFRPLLLCPVCMNSFWGVIIVLLSAYVNEVVIDLKFAISSLLSILISTFICYVANEYILHSEPNTE